jgi:hypothetical protein
VPHSDSSIDWERVIRDMIARNTESAPTEPGVYRMPCGNCYVDFFLASNGTERWLVPGDERSYTRETVAIARHGDYPWERMYTLGHAAAEIRRRALEDGVDPNDLLVRLVEAADAEKTAADTEAAEDAEIARIVRDRAHMDETSLADIARRFGVDLDEL